MQRLRLGFFCDSEISTNAWGVTLLLFGVLFILAGLGLFLVDTRDPGAPVVLGGGLGLGLLFLLGSHLIRRRLARSAADGMPAEGLLVEGAGVRAGRFRIRFGEDDALSNEQGSPVEEIRSVTARPVALAAGMRLLVTITPRPESSRFDIAGFFLFDKSRRVVGTERVGHGRCTLLVDGRLVNLARYAQDTNDHLVPSLDRVADALEKHGGGLRPSLVVSALRASADDYLRAGYLAGAIGTALVAAKDVMARAKVKKAVLDADAAIRHPETRESLMEWAERRGWDVQALFDGRAARR